MIPEPAALETHTVELLAPLARGIEAARLVVTLLAVATVLVIGGAKLERYLIKQRLSVVEGGSDGGRD